MTAAVLTATVLAAPDAQAVKVKAVLHPTAAAPAGAGKAVVSAKHSKGKFVVVGKHLTPNATFQVVVAGVPIGTLVTTPRGNGRARFSTTPRRNDQPLGVDPRGKHMTVHEMEDGEDELEGDVPDDDPNDVRCCLPDDDGVECEDRSEAECQAEGGIPKGPGSCMPNPCGDSTGGALVACCEREDDNEGEAECELRTATACTEDDGIAMSQTTCDPNPCVPAGGESVRCCVSDEGGEDGDQGDDNGDGGELECEHLTHQHCVDAGGSDLGPGSCEPDPCASPSGAFLDASAGAF